jgi:arylsulfatase
MDTPFQWTKQIASHFGRHPQSYGHLVAGQDQTGGGVRTQFHHVTDIMPTILEVAGIHAPDILNGVAQKPIEGVSMVYTFDDAAAPDRRTVANLRVSF